MPSSKRKAAPSGWSREQTNLSRAEERRPLLKRRTPSSAHAQCETYGLIHRIKDDMLEIIDMPLSLEQLHSPRIIYNIVRPLQDAYLALDNVSIIYTLLLVRCHFLRDASHALSLHSVNSTRAALCEIVAINILRAIYDRETKDPDATSRDALLKASELLAAAFSPFQGAPANVLKIASKRSSGYRAFIGATGISHHTDEIELADDDAADMHPYGKNNALEMAIIGEAKAFIRSPPAQLVVQAIWSGVIVYSPTTFWDILPDHYKRRQISLHKPSSSIYLDHYRLRVPRIRSVIELLEFMVLMALWIAVLQSRNHFEEITIVEIVFMVYGLGFTLDKLASTLEHGWRVYSANLWNGLDAALVGNFMTYAILRFIGIAHVASGEVVNSANYWAVDILSLGALLLFPRLAFTFLSDNVFFLALRAMLSQFVYLMLLASWCFLGFLYALWLMAEHSDMDYSLGYIGKLMIWIWFGLDGTGIHVARDFNPVIGPVVMVIYSCLANTLLLTILVAILSNTFANISSDPASEGMYRRAVTTFDTLKSDTLFAFVPPFNLLALVILTAIRPFVSKRKYHSITVLLTRIFSGPILLIIAVSELAGERRRKRALELDMVARQTANNVETPQGPHKALASSRFGALFTQMMLALRPRGAHDDIDLVFSVPKLAGTTRGTTSSEPEHGTVDEDDEEALGALFRGMPSLSPAAKAQLTGSHLLSPNTARTTAGEIRGEAPAKGGKEEERNVEEEEEEEEQQNESRIMPLARLFGAVRPQHMQQQAKKEKEKPAVTTPARKTAASASTTRPGTPTLAAASQASMIPDDLSDRMEGIEASMRRIEEALRAMPGLASRRHRDSDADNDSS